jgi:hypothetical protein
MKNGTVYTIKAKNIQAIEHFEALDINGSSILLIADNDRGKSTILRCLDAIAGDKKALDELELRFGTDAGYFEATKGIDGQEYLFRIDIEKGKSPALTMKRPDGVPIKTRSLITAVAKGVPFDVREFVNWSKSAEGKRKQLELVKKFLSQEELDIISGIEKQIKAQYDARTAVNQEAERLKGVISKSSITQEDYRIYAEKQEIANIQAEYDDLVKHNTTVSDVQSRISERTKSISELESHIQDLEEKLRLSKEALATAQTTQQKALQWVTENPPHPEANVQAIKDKIAGVSHHNTMVDKVNAKKESESKLKELQDESEGLTVTIEASRAELENTIKEIGLPIDELTFTSEEILYKGFPVDEHHQSFSEIVMLGARIKAALNPDNPVLCIENVETLGSEKYNALLDMRKQGWQIIGEHMERGVDKITYKIIGE